MESRVRQAVVEVKRRYDPEGFHILGVFGSQARGDASISSDLDILYDIEDKLLIKYPGLKFFDLYEQIKNDLENSTGLKVDLSSAGSLTQTGKKFILPELEHV